MSSTEPQPHETLRDKWLASRPRAFAGTAVLATDPDGRVLIVKPTYRDGWQFPGGIIDRDEDPATCAQRELWGETGLDVPELTLLAVTWSLPGPRLPHPAVNFLFDAGTFPEHTVIRLQAEELEAHWWLPPEDAAQLLLPTATTRMNAGLRARTTGRVELLRSGDDC